jgi:non-heme chloroperoxidase
VAARKERSSGIAVLGLDDPHATPAVALNRFGGGATGVFKRQQRWPYGLTSERRLMSEVEVNTRFLSKVGVHVEDSGGSGRPVVLIHGWPLSKDSWHAQVPVFNQAGFRVLAYDRRGFGQSDKPGGGYDYDTLTDDLDGLLSELDLRDVSLVGFSMGGGEVARYVSKYGEGRLHSVVFASAVPPYLLQTDDNPEGPLTRPQAATMTADPTADRDSFFDQFTTDFFSVAGDLKVTEAQRQDAIAMCRQSDQKAALACLTSFGTEDFRDDLTKVTVPTLVIHGSGDATVPFEGSGARTHKAITHSELVVLADAPHGCNVSHAGEFNAAVVQFLQS